MEIAAFARSSCSIDSGERRRDRSRTPNHCSFRPRLVRCASPTHTAAAEALDFFFLGFRAQRAFRTRATITFPTFFSTLLLARSIPPPPCTPDRFAPVFCQGPPHPLHLHLRRHLHRLGPPGRNIASRSRHPGSHRRRPRVWRAGCRRSWSSSSLRSPAERQSRSHSVTSAATGAPRPPTFRHYGLLGHTRSECDGAATGWRVSNRSWHSPVRD